MVGSSSAPCGAVAGMIVVIVVAVLFVTAEDPAGRIRVSKRASPNRRMLGAKALVIGGATFTTQLVAAIVAVQLGKRIMLSNGGVLPVSLLTELRIMVGTAAAVKSPNY